MHIRETLGCVVHVALIVIVGTALAATLAIFATEYLKLPDWTRWIFKGLVISLMTAGAAARMRQFARQIIPADQPIPDESMLSDDDQKLVWSIQLQFLLIALIVAVGFGVAGVAILPSAQSWVYARSPDTVFFVGVDPLVVFVPCLFFGILFTGLFGESLCKSMAGERWLAVRDVVYEPLGYELSKRLSWFWFSLMGLCLLPVALSFDNYARFTEQGVHMNRFWSLRERFVPHSEVEAIAELTHYKNLRTGAIEPYESPSYEVRFRDGTVFSTAHLRHRYDDYTHQLMRWWGEQAGVPIRKATRGVDW